MYRMRQREMVLALIGRRRQAARCADRARRAAHARTVFAAHTHTQPAQPTTIAHYLLAVIEQLERDTVRLACRLCQRRTGIRSAPAPSPGPGFRSIARRTSGTPRIRRADRQHVRQHRDGRLPARERVARRRFCWPGLAASSRICCCGARREFGYLRLADGFVQGSSIMPQKRNPVALEHARAIASKALGQATGDRAERPQHAVRRHRRHRGRSAAARGLDVQGREPGGASRRRGHGAGAVQPRQAR